ncbi:MAG: T9SS type A sorting domain-containing protein [Bacteroidia bacterium]
MKKSFTLQLRMLVLAAFVSVFSLNAETSICSSEGTISHDIFLTVPNNGTIERSSTIKIKVQFDLPQSARNIQILDTPSPLVKQPLARSVNLKDGKVDVDIIIRGSDIFPFLNPTIQTSQNQSRIHVGVISYITVDNISGVFESNDTNPTGDIASRLVSVEVLDDSEPTGNSGNTSSMFAIEASSGVYQTQSVSATIKTSSDFVLYPNPIRDNSFNIKSINGEFKATSISIFNALGSLVYQENINADISNYRIQLPVVPSGVYFVRINSLGSEVVKKFNLIH